MAACRACGAEIRWQRTLAGRSMPLDAVPDLAGNVVIVDGVAVVSRGMAEALIAEGHADGVFMPHHATCPNWGKR